LVFDVLGLSRGAHLAEALNFFIYDTVKTIAPELKQGMFVTACYAIYDMQENTLLLSSAGHNPIVLYRAKTRENELIKQSKASSGIIGTALGVYSPGSSYILLHHVMGDVDGNIGAWGLARGGMGAISTAIASALKEISYDKYASAEAFPWPDSDSAARATIDAFNQHLA